MDIGAAAADIPRGRSTADLGSGQSRHQVVGEERAAAGGVPRRTSWLAQPNSVPESPLISCAPGPFHVPHEDSTLSVAETEGKRGRGISFDLFRKRFRHGPPSEADAPPGFLRTAKTPRFVEAVGLTERMKTFVVIEVFEGHQIIGHWNCNDLVQHVNTIAGGYQRSPKSKKEELHLLALLREEDEQTADAGRRRRMTDDRTEDGERPTPTTTAGAIVHHHHHHYYAHPRARGTQRGGP